ncbi:hypothetical protein Pmani_038912 [Petrolisthes manimaculis]|uniref:Chitin-binding type-2 domain-containing protein n=1 Tax=Petrolisthes manimaculis TaxID=1843537 RepID=A0AAE1NF97_9EUCA|nr:hypothetical protein Pmani_038912 [Petrolisthes manimaculis]
MKETIVAVLLALVVTTAAQNPSTCTNPDPCQLNCVGCEDELLVPDPEDCHNYYICFNNASVPELPLTCPDGEHFNYTTHQCVPGDDCEGCGGMSGVCHYQCVEQGNPYATHGQQFDCSTYTICNSGDDLITVTCPPEAPYYDGAGCQTDESKCCSCYPYCTIDDIGHLIYDPADCTKYYACSGLGIPENFGTCPDGDNFDPNSGTCSSTIPCSTPSSCLNKVSPDGCISRYTCQEFGVEAKCRTQCLKEYYYCTINDIDNIVEPITCQGDLVFNPENHQCVTVDDCPFPSSFMSLNTTMLSRKV